MKISFVFAGMLALTLHSAHAETYRWVDSSGKVQYGDHPPLTDGVTVEVVKLFATPEADNADLPYETRHAQENFPVTFYSAENCIEPCRLARDFLNKRGIPFSEKILVTKEEVDAFKQQFGATQLPTLAVGKNFLQGFQMEQWDSELDIAGYPRIAPYRSKANVKPEPVKLNDETAPQINPPELP